MKPNRSAALFLVFALSGCSDSPSDSAKLSDKEREILESAKRAVAQFENWADHAEYKVERHGSQWQVTAWRVEHPEAKGTARYVPWGNRKIILDDRGRVLQYGTRKQVSTER